MRAVPVAVYLESHKTCNFHQLLRIQELLKSLICDGNCINIAAFAYYYCNIQPGICSFDEQIIVCCVLCALAQKVKHESKVQMELELEVFKT